MFRGSLCVWIPELWGDIIFYFPHEKSNLITILGLIDKKSNHFGLSYQKIRIDIKVLKMEDKETKIYSGKIKELCKKLLNESRKSVSK